MAFNFLIVDDSLVVRKVLKKTLGLSGIPVGEIVEAENGLVGLEKLKESWVDLIFLDINMPVMNGVEFIQNLRTEAEYQNTPVVIVSTEGSETRIAELNNFGVRAYLRKPVTPEQLSDAVYQILGTNL